jgi:adenylate cyclase
MSERPANTPGSRFAAAAQRFNRSPKLVAWVRQTRERALGDEERIDHLSTARGRPADRAARQLVALRGAEPGFAGELGLTALQAWQRLAESQDRGHGKVDVAILFTDLVGFSSWALEAGDRSAVRLLRKVSEAIEPPVLERQGEVVKRLGDGLMAAFWDAPSAIETAFAAGERVAPIEVDGYRPVLRTGIHLGRPRKLGGDYFGIDVNVAARLADAARPGEILVSGAKKRRFSAKGAPKGMAAYAVSRSIA